MKLESPPEKTGWHHSTENNDQQVQFLVLSLTHLINPALLRFESQMARTETPTKHTVLAAPTLPTQGLGVHTQEQIHPFRLPMNFRQPRQRPSSLR
jgi:hypothetical protein